MIQDSESIQDKPLLARPIPRPSVRERASLRLALAFQTLALLADIGTVFLAFRIGYALRYRLEIGGNVGPETWSSWSTFSVPATVAVVMMLVIFPMRGVYQVRQKLSLIDYVPRIIGGWTMVLAGIIMVAFFFQFTRSRLIFIYAGMFGLAFMFGHRVLAALIRRWLWRHGIGADRVLVVGEGPAGRRLMQSIIRDSGLGYRLVGYAGDASRGDRLHIATERGVLTCPRLGDVGDVRDLVLRHDVDDVMVVEDRDGSVDVRHTLDQCRGLSVQFRIVPDLLQISLDRVDVSQIDGVPTIGVRDASIHGWNAVLKRTVDIVMGVLVCIVGFVPAIVLAILIKRDSDGPVFYRQTRVGQFGDSFTMLKFRCMVDNADQMWEELAATNVENQGRIFKDPEDPRITRIGRMLRRYSIDELPQFVNVLKGDMSMIGPRPPLPREVAEYDEWHLQRLLVRPGLTGLWQVNGRSDLSFDEMVRLDLYYAENWSPWLDIKVLLRTIPAVLLGRGAY